MSVSPAIVIRPRAEPGLVTRWLARCDAQLKPKTAFEYRRIVRKHLLPALAEIPADKITRADIRRALDAIPSPDVARCALIVARSFFGWAISEGYLDIPANPCTGIKRGRSKARDRVLSLQELAAIWNAVERLHCYQHIVRLLILTGARRGEIGGLTWSEVNFRVAVDPRLELPPERVKNGRPFTIPLVPLALACLPRQRPGYPHLFGRVQQTPFDGWGHCKPLLDERLRGAGMDGPFVIHDIRRSFVTHANELELASPAVIEACVGHVVPGVAGVYNRAKHEAAKRACLTAWADRIGELVPLTGPAPGSLWAEMERANGAG